MNWLVSIGIGLVTAIISAALTAWIADMAVRWQRVSSFEGAAGYAVVAFVLIALILGFVIGVVTSRFAPPSYLPAQGMALAVAGGVIAIGTFLAWVTGDQPPTLDGDTLIIQAEFRFPAGWEPERAIRSGQGNYSYLTPLGMGNERRQGYMGEANFKSARQENGQWIVPVDVYLFTTRTPRLLSITLANKSRAEFALKLPARPDRSHLAWSNWISDGFLQEVGKPPREGYSYRLRLVKSEELERAEKAAAQALVDQRKRDFAALKPDSPITDWLRFIDEDATGEERGAATAMIQKRAAELAPVLRSNDRRALLRALRALDFYTFKFDPALAEPLIDAGRQIPEIVKRARAAGSQEDPDLAAQVEAKFILMAWHESLDKAATAIPNATRKAIFEQIMAVSADYEGPGEMRSIHGLASHYLEELEKQP